MVTIDQIKEEISKRDYLEFLVPVLLLAMVLDKLLILGFHSYLVARRRFLCTKMYFS